MFTNMSVNAFLGKQASYKNTIQNFYFTQFEILVNMHGYIFYTIARYATN